MDIKKVGGQSVYESQTSQAKSAEKTKSGQESADVKTLLGGMAAAPSKNVEWSEDAQIVKEAVAIAKAAPDIRSEKVSRLKEMIKNGTYKMDSSKIADSMIQSSMEEALIQGAKN